MAERLNIRFVSAPKQFLEHTVVFTDGLLTGESAALTRNKLTHFFDLEPLKGRTALRVLAGQHLYSNDTHISGYFVKPGSSTMVPVGDTPHPYIFLSEFTSCRLLVRRDGDNWLRFEMEDNLSGSVPPAEGPGSPFTDSYAYWDNTSGYLVGSIRGTAVVVKEPGGVWTIYMQQIVGTAGFEQVRMLFTRPLRY
ncbi:MAG: hypothetical protein WA324_13105 [Bryobacteraceae bacterium]